MLFVLHQISAMIRRREEGRDPEHSDALCNTIDELTPAGRYIKYEELVKLASKKSVFINGPTYISEG